MVTPTEAVARTVCAAMDRGGKSAKQLAEETHIPRTTLARRLAGQSPFTIPELEQVAAALGTTARDILTDAESAAVA